MLSLPFILNAQWVQEDIDIDGKAAGDRSGWSIDMPDSRNIVIGSPKNNGIGIESGLVRVYRSFGGTWLKIGQDMEGDTIGENFGSSVSMADSNTFAVGSPNYKRSLLGKDGKVRVYSWLISSPFWAQKGSDIYGYRIEGQYGFAVEMPDNNTIAISSPVQTFNLSRDSSYVNVLRWDGFNWVQKGLRIRTNQRGNFFGYSLSMPDTNTLAIGAPDNSSIASPGNGGGLNSGATQVYKWNGNAWVKKGQLINGFGANSRSGKSVFMPDSNTLAIGEPSIPNPPNSQIVMVRVFRWQGNRWVQKGPSILGNNSSKKNFGISLSMANSNFITIGTTSNETYSYRWNGSNWIQYGTSIIGENPLDSSGWAVCMPDTNYIGIGAPFNDGNGTNSGHVRIFKYNLSTANKEIESNNNFSIFPNPTNGQISIETSNSIGEVVQISSISGKVLKEITISQDREVIDLSSFDNGIYFLRIGNSTKKIVKID